MTVRELIEQLQGLNGDLPVHFGYDYGDRTHTTVTPEVTNVDTLPVKYSAYHQRPALVTNEDFDDEPGVIQAVVLL